MENPNKNDIEFVLSSTRSVRKKLDYSRPISKEDLIACVNAAVQAPTGIIMKMVLILTDKKLKSDIAKLYRQILLEITKTRGIALKSSHLALMDRLHEIPCMIFVLAIGEPGDSVSEQVGFYGSILPAAWSMMVAMRARGIGTTWTSLLTSKSTEIAKILSIPEDVTQTVMFPAAYTLGAVLRPANRKPAEDVIFWNTWDNQNSTLD